MRVSSPCALSPAPNPSHCPPSDSLLDTALSILQELSEPGSSLCPSACLAQLLLQGIVGSRWGGGVRESGANKPSWKRYMREKGPMQSSAFLPSTPAVKGVHPLGGCLGLSKPLNKPAKIFKKSFLNIFSSFIYLFFLKHVKMFRKIRKGWRSPSLAALLPQSVIKNAPPAQD